VHRHEVEDGGRVALGGRRRAPPLSLGRPVQAELDREGRGGHKGGDDYYITIIDETVEPLRRLKECADAHKADRALTGERGGKLNYTLWRKHLDNARKTSGVSYTDHPCTTFARASCGPAARPSMRSCTRWATRPAPSPRVYLHAFKMDRSELAKRLRMPTTGVEGDDSIEKADAK